MPDLLIMYIFNYFNNFLSYNIIYNQKLFTPVFEIEKRYMHSLIHVPAGSFTPTAILTFTFWRTSLKHTKANLVVRKIMYSLLLVNVSEYQLLCGLILNLWNSGQDWTCPTLWMLLRHYFVSLIVRHSQTCDLMYTQTWQKNLAGFSAECA